MIVYQQDYYQKSEREVIAIYENNKNPSELSEGQVIVQTMTETKNKVTIPLKKHSKKVTIEELKTNLLKHLPKIVHVN